MFKDNKWVIPSHYDYPADAHDRLAKTAAAVMDLTKDTIRSDSAEDQEEMGVIDPLDTKVTTLKGRGKRITLRDASEKVLADFIIGNEIKDRTGQRYVRVPGQKRTYGVNVKAEPSTRFADWIETNLLKLEASQDPQGRVRQLQGQPRTGLSAGRGADIERKDSAAPWTMAGLARRPGARHRQAAHPHRRPGRSQDRRRPAQAGRPDPRPQEERQGRGSSSRPRPSLSLQSKGFYMTRDGQLLSNQGDVRVYTDEGVVYTLRFGEVVFGTGDELTAGDARRRREEGDEKATPRIRTKPKKKAEGTTENRYVMVTVVVRPDADPQAQGRRRRTSQAAPSPASRSSSPPTPFAPDPNDPKIVADEKEAKEKAEREQKRLREEDRRRQEAGPGADRPVRRLVLRHPRRQLPLDQPRPRRARPAQEGRPGQLRPGGLPRPSPAAAADVPQAALAADPALSPDDPTDAAPGRRVRPRAWLGVRACASRAGSGRLRDAIASSMACALAGTRPDSRKFLMLVHAWQPGDRPSSVRALDMPSMRKRRWRHHESRVRIRPTQRQRLAKTGRMRHVLSALVQNQPGVLAHVSGMFASRGFNIDSLAVGETENPHLSRITVVVMGDDRHLEQVRKQLEKIVTVVKVHDISREDYVERDLMLIKIKAPPADRPEIQSLVQIFRGRIVDVSPEQS